MSIAAALSNAASGLAVVSRATDVVSANVANALTPGYGRRAVVLASAGNGSGVRIASVERLVSASLLADSRLAAARFGGDEVRAAFRTGIEAALGLRTEGAALTDKVSALEADLVAATARPDNPLRLTAVASSAADLVSAVRNAAGAVSAARTEADRGIASDVATLRSGLTEVARLNRAIIVDQANGRDAAALIDARQQVIDSLSSIVAIREVPRENGRVALFTQGGAMLLDGETPVDLDFHPAGQLTPAMSVGTPPVSRLAMGGEEIDGRLMSLFAGGTLEAHFAVRDRLAPEAQARLDAFARDLCDRFADPSLDPSLATGAPGLFTDAGAAADPAQELGLANRLALHAAIDPPGTADWRLRDGLGAAAPGDEGSSVLLAALADRLGASRPTASAALSPGSRSTARLAAEIGAMVSTERVAAEAASTRSAVHADALAGQLLADGVDTDHEMQRLLELEKAYAANAKVIMAADAMISRILEI